MPLTRYRLNDNARQASPTPRDEEIELARVNLELNSRVQPTWGPSVEPDAYITDLEGDIPVSRQGADDELRVGTLSANSAHLGEADEDGAPWFDVLDACDGDTAMYSDLIDASGSCYGEWVESNLERFGNDLLALIELESNPNTEATVMGSRQHN